MTMTNAKQRRKITMAALVVALGAAVYLNWQYARTDVPLGFEVEDSMVLSPEEGVTSDVNKNYGDAQLVSAAKDSGSAYFEEAALKRTKTRDEALDKLQKSLKNADLTAEEKQQLTEKLSAVITAMTAEGDIENLVKAKGFADCLAFIDERKVTVTVSTGGTALSQAQVAQIRDIVLTKLDVEAKNISIVEVK